VPSVIAVLYISVSVADAGTTVLRGTGIDATANDVSADIPYGQRESVAYLEMARHVYTKLIAYFILHAVVSHEST